MPAAFGESRDDGTVDCLLCAHRCRIPSGQRGRCGVRANLRGTLVSMVEKVITGTALDPMEKKPLYHFLPGTRTFSVGSAGCNFSCLFCQNHEISRGPAEDGKVTGRQVDADILVDLARRNCAESMAFTYNEPTVFFELVFSTAGLARKQGLRTILVTNGFMSEDCLVSLQRRINAANVDLKGFSESFYRKYCGGRLQPVLDNLKRMKALGWWVEVTTLIIPGVNDGSDELREAARFIRDELGPDTPWHLTAFRKAYHMTDHPETPVGQLEDCWALARGEGLHFVYVGNVISAVGGNTYCPQCNAVCIERQGWHVRFKGASAGICPACGYVFPGVWR